MVAATDVIFICGSRTIDKDVVLQFFEMLVALHATYWTLLIHAEGIELNGDAITLGNTYLRAHSWETHNILQKIYITGKSLASDGRDKIYAVLGLACDARRLVQTPDYSLPVEESHKKFAASWVKEYHSLKFLSLASLPVYPRKKDLPLPSWTPDWGHRHAATLNSTIRPATITNASRGKLAHADFSLGLDTLTVRGVCVDVIEGMRYSIWGARTEMAGHELQ